MEGKMLWLFFPPVLLIMDGLGTKLVRSVPYTNGTTKVFLCYATQIIMHTISCSPYCISYIIFSCTVKTIITERVTSH